MGFAVRRAIFRLRARAESLAPSPRLQAGGRPPWRAAAGRQVKGAAIATPGPATSASWPDVRTFAELGWHGYDMSVWTGMWVPAGTPKDIVVRLQQEVAKAITSADMKARFADLGVQSVGNPSEQFAAFVAAEIAKWGKVVRDTGMRVE